MLVHPLVVVRREPLGRLAEVAADVEPDDAIDPKDLQPEYAEPKQKAASDATEVI